MDLSGKNEDSELSNPRGIASNTPHPGSCCKGAFNFNHKLFSWQPTVKLKQVSQDKEALLWFTSFMQHPLGVQFQEKQIGSSDKADAALSSASTGCHWLLAHCGASERLAAHAGASGWYRQWFACGCVQGCAFINVTTGSTSLPLADQSWQASRLQTAYARLPGTSGVGRVTKLCRWLGVCLCSHPYSPVLALWSGCYLAP